MRFLGFPWLPPAPAPAAEPITVTPAEELSDLAAACCWIAIVVLGFAFWQSRVILQERSRERQSQQRSLQRSLACPAIVELASGAPQSPIVVACANMMQSFDERRPRTPGGRMPRVPSMPTLAEMAEENCSLFDEEAEPTGGLCDAAHSEEDGGEACDAHPAAEQQQQPATADGAAAAVDGLPCPATTKCADGECVAPPRRARIDRVGRTLRSTALAKPPRLPHTDVPAPSGHLTIMEVIANFARAHGAPMPAVDARGGAPLVLPPRSACAEVYAQVCEALIVWESEFISAAPVHQCATETERRRQRARRRQKKPALLDRATTAVC